MNTTTSTTRRTHLSDLHHDQLMWLNTLAYRKEEIKLFERRMEDVVRRKPDTSVLAELEHFQNQYIREREVIDELRHDIKQHENRLEKRGGDGVVDEGDALLAAHGELKDRMETFVKLYDELRRDFLRWVRTKA